MDWDRPYWAGFAVAFVSLSTIGQSLNKAALRVLGTLDPEPWRWVWPRGTGRTGKFSGPVTAARRLSRLFARRTPGGCFPQRWSGIQSKTERPRRRRVPSLRAVPGVFDPMFPQRTVVNSGEQTGLDPTALAAFPTNPCAACSRVSPRADNRGHLPSSRVCLYRTRGMATVPSIAIPEPALRLNRR
jgi:hypothetical protein